MKWFQMMAILSAFVAMSVSCNNQQNGGGCTYDIDTIPATLIKLVDINDKSYDALFEVNYEGRKDTLSYAAKNHQQYIFSEETPKDSLVTGRQYQYIVKNIISGHCNPIVDVIRLSVFNQQ